MSTGRTESRPPSDSASGRYGFLAALIIVALIGGLLLAYAAPRGMGLVNDSVSYVQGARSLLAGTGYGRPAGDGSIKPITHFPPLYPLLLAGFGLFGQDAIPAARSANLILFGLNILLVGLLARRLTRSGAAGLFAAALFAASETLLRIHTFALSEPLFLALTLGGLLCLLIYLETGTRRTALLAGAAVLAALSFLTRYVGAALFAAGLAVVVLAAGPPQPGAGSSNGKRLAIRSLRDGLLFLAAALPLVLVWTVRNLLLTGSATNRDLSVHPIAASELLEGLKNFWAFVLPGRLGMYERLPAVFWAVLFATGLLVLVGLLVRLVLRWQRENTGVVLIGLHALAYLALVIFSMTVVDASTIFEDRILAPFYVDLLLLAVVGLIWLTRRAGQGWRLAAVVLALGLLLTFMDDTRRALPELRLDGQGFASSRWSNSELVDAARRLPVVTIYTNRLAGLSLLTNRPMYALLGPVDPVSQQPRAGYAEGYAAIRTAVQNGRAALVVFSAQALADNPDEAWFRDLITGLPVYASFDDGIIYGVFPGQ